MPDLDLTGGRPGAMGGAGGRPASGPRPTGEAARERAEKALKGDLEGVFARIADVLLARGDEELGGAINEDKAVLSTGLVSATETLTPLRRPLVLGVRLIEPILAFGRIVGILARRVRARFAYDEEGEGIHPGPPV